MTAPTSGPLDLPSSARRAVSPPADPAGGETGRPDDGWWPGIDSPQLPYLTILQYDVAATDVAGAAAVLDDVQGALAETGVHAGFRRSAGAGMPAGTVLVGMSVRLVRGEWTAWRDDDGYSDRWRRAVRCPPSLKTMDAKRDDEFPAFATESRRVSHETDLCLLVEAAEAGVGERVSAALGELAPGLRSRAVHTGLLGADRRDPFGFVDGTSNLQHLRSTDPARYRSHILTAGRPVGTFLVFRKYRAYPDRLAPGEVLRLPAARGGDERTFRPEQVIGRDRSSGLVVEPVTGARLRPEPDEAQAACAYAMSHIAKANPRGSGTTNFGQRVTVPRHRLLRRSYPYREKTECGLLFLAFQADIADGFEFIHNEWLMSDFNGGVDPLLAPDAGLVEPLTGCYYFLPRRQDRLAEVFRSLTRTRRQVMSQPDSAAREDDVVRATVDVPAASPAEAIEAFLAPEAVERWWGGKLLVDRRPGGRYLVDFPQLGQTMRGEVLDYDPTTLLAFSWAWDHEPELPIRRVEVRAVPQDRGTRVEVTHGPYEDTAADRADADSHVEGWAYFLPALADYLTPQPG